MTTGTSRVPIRLKIMRRRVLLSMMLLVCASSADAASRYFADRSGAPVRWERWGGAAFARAVKEKRPVFLSIGFASSYECYRMHREAFLNGENAEVLNTHFVPVLLDRIEHPDVAESFESMARVMSGVTGWPVQLVLNARREPFAAAGFLGAEELNRFLVINANRFVEGPEGFVPPAVLKPAAPFDVEAVVDAIGKTYDPGHGGFGGIPRHARPMTLSFLLRYAGRTKHEGVRGVAIETLKKLAISPLRDQIGGGFHRATRDAGWREPYFEKMLPDQALLTVAYLEAWQQTDDPQMAWLTRTTLDYVLRDLRGTRGAFDASQDAYNFVPLHGPELVNGNFYQWRKDEIARLVGRERASTIFMLYGMKDGVENLPALGEWRFLAETHDSLAAPLAKMLDVRQKRPEPSREFNVIAGWNGLMISALSRAGAALGEKAYVDAATSSAAAVTASHWNPKTRRLLRSEGNEALSEDYAFLVQGLLDLFDASYEVRWLELAITLQQRHDELFWDPAEGAYSKDADDDVPSASSVAALNLLRLAALTGNEAWRMRPAVIFQAFGGRVRANGAAWAQLASAYELSLVAPRIVVVTGPPRAKATFDLLQSYAMKPEPMRALLFVPDKGAARERIVRVLPFLRALEPDPEAPVAHVCAAGECSREPARPSAGGSGIDPGATPVAVIDHR